MSLLAVWLSAANAVLMGLPRCHASDSTQDSAHSLNLTGYHLSHSGYVGRLDRSDNVVVPGDDVGGFDTLNATQCLGNLLGAAL